MIDRLRDSPIPIPMRFVVKKASRILSMSSGLIPIVSAGIRRHQFSRFWRCQCPSILLHEHTTAPPAYELVASQATAIRPNQTCYKKAPSSAVSLSGRNEAEANAGAPEITTEAGG
jgi:hypothetical protein